VNRPKDTLLIPFARRRADGRMVDVSQVDSGLDCNCECPGCDQTVLARKCTAKISHFAHAVSAACEGALESSLHAAAKQIITALGFVWLPRSLAGIGRTKFVFARCETEKARNKIRPDLTLYTKGGKPLAIEVCVTHEIDDTKEKYVRSQKLACIEYDLGDLPRDLTYAELNRRFVEDEVFGEWVFNEKAEALEEQRAEEARRRMKQAEEKENAEERRQRTELEAWLKSPHAKPKELVVLGEPEHGTVTPCPIRRRGSVEKFKGLAFADIDCPKCAYFAGRCESPAVVKCIGHFPKLALADDEIVRRFGGNITKREPKWPSAHAEVSSTDENPF
jgi:hypothetical protein